MICRARDSVSQGFGQPKSLLQSDSCSSVVHQPASSRLAGNRRASAIGSFVAAKEVMESTTQTSETKASFVLYTYYRSSCSGRVRLALLLKNIPADYVYVHLSKGEQLAEEHVKLNPSASVPVLTHLSEEGTTFPVTQSIAALEYLEELFPDQVPLLPPASQPLERAKVRTLVNIISNDIQPVTNRRIARAIEEIGGDSLKWSKLYMTRGLQAYEAIASKSAGRFSVGDNVSMADVCLVPAIWTAEKHDVDLGSMPVVSRIYAALSELQAVQKAHWSCQGDTPVDQAWL